MWIDINIQNISVYIMVIKIKNIPFILSILRVLYYKGLLR